MLLLLLLLLLFISFVIRKFVWTWCHQVPPHISTLWISTVIVRSRVQKFPAWHTKAAPNGKCCEGYIVPSMVRLMYQFVVCWNKGRLCWKIAKLFYFCHLKKLVRPETFGPYCVHVSAASLRTSELGGPISSLLANWRKILKSRAVIDIRKIRYVCRVFFLFSVKFLATMQIIFFLAFVLAVKTSKPFDTGRRNSASGHVVIISINAVWNRILYRNVG